MENLTKDLRPISLTACLSKVAEEFVVEEHMKPAILKIHDPNQYGIVPKSSTTHAVIHVVHSWAKGTDGNDATVRNLFFDFGKAFDLMDHNILANKLCDLNIRNALLIG